MSDDEVDRMADRWLSKDRVRTTVWLSILVLGMVWVFCLFPAAENFDPAANGGKVMSSRNSFPLPMAFVITAIVIGFATVRIRRIWELNAVGVRTSGTIANVGLFWEEGQVRATVIYMANGREFRLRKFFKGGIAPGDIVKVIYDPHNPRRCDVW